MTQIGILQFWNSKSIDGPVQSQDFDLNITSSDSNLPPRLLGWTITDISTSGKTINLSFDKWKMISEEEQKGVKLQTWRSELYAYNSRFYLEYQNTYVESTNRSSYGVFTLNFSGGSFPTGTYNLNVLSTDKIKTYSNKVLSDSIRFTMNNSDTQ